MTVAAFGVPTVTDILAELDALIGLGAVKAQVRSVIAVVQANTVFVMSMPWSLASFINEIALDAAGIDEWDGHVFVSLHPSPSPLPMQFGALMERFHNASRAYPVTTRDVGRERTR